MTYELQLQLEIFRLMLSESRRQAREVRAIGQLMREQATSMRVSAHAGLEQVTARTLKAQPIANVL